MKENNIKSVLRDSRNQEVESTLVTLLSDLEREGLSVEFGRIGLRTNYALIHDKDYNVEILGYTFLKDLKYYKENVGKLKALQQAIARKNMAESKS